MPPLLFGSFKQMAAAHLLGFDSFSKDGNTVSRFLKPAAFAPEAFTCYLASKFLITSSGRGESEGANPHPAFLGGLGGLPRS